MSYLTVHGCPVPARLQPVVEKVAAASGATLLSCYRGKDAEAILHANNKMSQDELYRNWLRDPLHWNPANQPGFSTHELRSDGIAYAVPRGARLPYWCVGQDWSNASGVVRAYAALNFVASVTYPTNPRELHHVNLRREPKVNIWKFRPLELGMTGWRVKRVQRYLGKIKDPNTGKIYFARSPGKTFGPRLEEAVVAFQKDHMQKPDGIVGIQTYRQLQTSYRKATKPKKK
jgi:hypothetical protein